MPVTETVRTVPPILRLAGVPMGQASPHALVLFVVLELGFVLAARAAYGSRKGFNPPPLKSSYKTF